MDLMQQAESGQWALTSLIGEPTQAFHPPHQDGIFVSSLKAYHIHMGCMMIGFIMTLQHHPTVKRVGAGSELAVDIRNLMGLAHISVVRQRFLRPSSGHPQQYKE